MRLRRTIIMLIVAAFSIGMQATNVDLKREAKFPKRGARMPSITRVTADYENENVTTNITGYTGSVQVVISDMNGQVVGYTLASVSENGTVILSSNTCSGECYSLSIILDNAIYSGQFYA